MTFAGATFSPAAEVVSGWAAPVKLAWSKPLGVGVAMAPPSIGADADLVLVPTMNVTGEDLAREFYLEAHSLTSGAIEWRRQLSPKQGGCPRVQEDSLPFTTSSFVGNGEVVANFWFQEDINTHCSGFVLLDCKVIHSTGNIKSRQTVDAGFSYTANIKDLLYIARIEANLLSMTNNELFRLAPPTFELAEPAANFSWPIMDMAEVSQEPNILVSPWQRLLVLFQASTGAMALMGLDLTTLQPLWSTKAPARASWARLQLSGPRHNIILLKTNAYFRPPYNTSIAAYNAANGHLLWQHTVVWNSMPVTTLHGVVEQGKQQLVCATYQVLDATMLMCHNPFTGDLAFSKQLTAQQHFWAIYHQWLLVQDVAKGQLMAIDPFTRTRAWTIPIEEGSTRIDMADGNSFLLLSSATGLAKWSVYSSS
ncbi:uncharacterized protein ACA1_093870 [Acanthamoeba castellanii str. Neff]|uniref:Pyrrolo-quinoline quinone repeat domain-containing protein n=1 Tax=Acanthamoeba castellanii (strain ATCC 30010 / Neff) TaxID=1257118 RepID=L8GIC0_ACACF|nr:uncharacterized protein ACA1_093870 [Acanthamoeba castellanii str. Neff]ELR12840.1 hypothetical protein ACA1_093870 [Acanthamoeba castellanii str. Neff]